MKKGAINPSETEKEQRVDKTPFACRFRMRS